MNKYPWQGIRIKIHPLFWCVICLSVWTGHFIEIVTLFVLVIIHELGHITAAWSYGWRVRSIELLPFGGVATMDEWGYAPAKEEIVVALAGPFHHILIVLMSVGFYACGWWSLAWTSYFVQGNLLIAVFNLLPIYPLDGGRVMQAIVSNYLPYRTCLLYTLLASLCLAGLLIVASFLLPGVWVHFPLFIVAAFLLATNWLALKRRSYQYVQFLLHRLDHGVPDAYPLHKVSVASDVPLSQVLKKWHRGRYHIVEVYDDQGEICGLLNEENALRAYFRRDWRQVERLVK